MRLKAGGLLWEAVVCSSFVFANSSNTKRTVTNPYGDTEYEQVLQGNMMADMAAFFMALASSRGVEVCLENPAGSMIFRYPPLVEVLAGLKVVMTTTDQCWFSSKPFGKRWQKKFKLAATGTWIFRMSRSCRCPGGVHEPLMTTNENGAVTGTKQLKLSQAYPPKFGESVVAAWALGEMKQVDDIAARCKKRNFKDLDESKASGDAAAAWQVPSVKATRKRPCAQAKPAPKARAAAKPAPKAKAAAEPAPRAVAADWTVPRQ